MALSPGLTADGGCGGGRCLSGWPRPRMDFWVNSSGAVFALMVLSGIRGQVPPMRLFIRFHIRCELLLVPGGSPPLVSWKARSSYSNWRFSFSLLERAIMAGLITYGLRTPKSFADLILNMETCGEVLGGSNCDGPNVRAPSDSGFWSPTGHLVGPKCNGGSGGH